MAPTAPEPLCFREARLLLYRVFDIADDIDLDRAQELLAGAGTRLKLTRERSQYLEIPRAPLTVSLGRDEVVGQSGTRFPAVVQARIFSFGALSFRYEVSLPPPGDSAQAAALVREFEASRELEAAARREAAKLGERLAPALDTPHHWEGMETYAVLFARELLGAAPPRSLANDPRMARIILAEDAAVDLTPEEVADATQRWFSYAGRDLSIIDWNTAVVIEPDGLQDIPDMLEFATAQLLEFRFYDALLDREMESLYDLLSKREPLLWRLGGHYRRLGRQLNRRILETVEFVERVENALKVIADTYLARIYLAAIETFRVPAWLAGVNRKQDLTRQMAEVLSNESQATTSHLLEIVVIILIAYEILAPFLRRLG